jgi:hypothetical protein
MLVDLAQERWAARRPVSAEVWRCVAPHADAEGISALVRAFETGGERERLSVALALQQPASQLVDAAFGQQGLRNQLTDLQSYLVTEKIDWTSLA